MQNEADGALDVLHPLFLLIPMAISSQSGNQSEAKLTCDHLWKVFGPNVDRLIRDSAIIDLPAPQRRQKLEAVGQIVAVEDVSFSVQRGELFVIMGLSGSGKSTVVRGIAQLQRPSFGRVFLDDTQLNSMSEHELRVIRRRKIGMVFQNFGLVPHFTALENIAFPLKVRGEQKQGLMTKAEEMLNLVGLDGRGGAYPSELSGGQQQRVGIARSLAVDPEVWLLDEPFSALDPLIRRQLQDELLELQSRLHKTIVFITHDFAEAVKLADRIAIMRDGRIVQLGSPADLLLSPADDYVASFVQDVSRLRVLKLVDIMSATTRERGNEGRTVSVKASTTLEECLISLPADAESIAVTDKDGAIIGECSRQHLLAVAANQSER